MTHKEYMREWRNRPGNREKQYKLSAAWRKKNKGIKNRHSIDWFRRNPLIRRVERQLQRAVYAGRIIRPDSCEHCGKICKPHGHHFDYTQPFNVMWLCHDCHMAQHRKFPGLDKQKEADCEGK